jgi:hypothetical protein
VKEECICAASQTRACRSRDRFALKLSSLSRNLLGVRVVNRGDKEAVEVIQLYVADKVTSATWAVHELKGFGRVKLPAKAAQEVKVCHLPEPASEHLPPPGTVATAPAVSRPDRSRPPHWLLQAGSRLCHQPSFWPCAQFMLEPISCSQMHWGWGDRALSGTVAIGESQK